MREAMQAGAHYVGGLDPTNVDGAMEKSLDTMFQIALDYDKGVDIHLHETSPAGVAAVNYMVETVEKTPALKGKLTISTPSRWPRSTSSRSMKSPPAWRRSR